MKHKMQVTQAEYVDAELNLIIRHHDTGKGITVVGWDFVPKKELQDVERPEVF